jgi:hypothetical protein
LAGDETLEVSQAVGGRENLSGRYQDAGADRDELDAGGGLCGRGDAEECTHAVEHVVGVSDAADDQLTAAGRLLLMRMMVIIKKLLLLLMMMMIIIIIIMLMMIMMTVMGMLMMLWETKGVPQ